MNYVINYVGEGNTPHHFYILNHTNPINSVDITQFINFAFRDSIVESLTIDEFETADYVLCFILPTTNDVTLTYEKVCNADNMQQYISEFLTKYPDGRFECEPYASFEKEWKQETNNYLAFMEVSDNCKTCPFLEFDYLIYSDENTNKNSMVCNKFERHITKELSDDCDE